MFQWMTRMIRMKAGDFTGYSTAGIDDAIQDALAKAGDHVRIEVVETRGSQVKNDVSQYQATLAVFDL